MPHEKHDELSVEERWRLALVEGAGLSDRRRRFFATLPGDPRCKFCLAPFEGIGGWFVQTVFHKRRSNMNPRLCNFCEEFAEEHGGGAEIELALLFADVRGSTALGEQMTPSAFSQLMNRFYSVATDILVSSDAMIDKFVGDEVIALYLPGFAGSAYTRRAIDAAHDLLEATGHASRGGPWIPVGASVHAGTAFVGAVGRPGGVMDITALGDAVNVGARLAAQAGAGEAIISERAGQLAGLPEAGLERRQLALKGRSEPVNVWILHVAPPEVA